MRLFTTELRRFWGRRITWGIAIVVSMFIVLAVAITFTQVGDPDIDRSQQRERAERDAARNTESCSDSVLFDLENGNGDQFEGESELRSLYEELSEEEFREYLAQGFCYSDPAWFTDDNTFYASILLGEQTSDWSASRTSSNEPITYRQGGTEIREARPGLTGILPSISVFFLVIAVVIGASFVGAEYKFGTVENLLLWEPRRTRVLLTKFAAGFLSSAALTAAVLMFAFVVFYLLALVKGSTDGLDGQFWSDLVATLFRSGLAGGLFFILAMSVAVIARNTTASVGIILGWFVISNIVIEVAAKWFRPWELFSNATAFIAQGDATKYEKINGFDQSVFSHGYLVAGLIVAVWAAVFATFAMLAFNRRDVD